jgi:hypothetical protein
METRMPHRIVRALLVTAVVVLTSTRAFACLGAYESWVLARVDEALVASAQPAAELAEARKLREQGARLMTERRYDAARKVLERAAQTLHVDLKGDEADGSVPTVGVEPGCGVPPKP